MANRKWLLIFLLTTLAASPESPARTRKNKLLDQAEQAVEAKLTKAPVAEEVCFSPDMHCDIKFLKYIQSAQNEIDMAIYDINLDQLAHELLLASRKIKVRVIVDQRQSQGEHSLVSTLIKGGVDVRYGRQRGIMHDKFTIVDNKMVETGSFNYTHHASEANQENQIYLASAPVVAKYKERFETMWDHAKVERGLSSETSPK